MLWFVRHAAVDLDLARPASTWELTAEGRADAEAVAARLAPVARVLSSPERKAVATAEPIAARSGVELELDPIEIVGLAQRRGLRVQYEIGPKHEGPMTRSTITELLDRAARWLDAGAEQIVVEARESAVGVGLFNDQGDLEAELADAFADRFGLDALTFEAPTKPSQFAFLDLFGPEVGLSNVRLEELLRVEIYRRGLHSDAFARPNLRPAAPSHDARS